MERKLGKFFFRYICEFEFNAVSVFICIAVEIAGYLLTAADFYRLGLSGLGVIAGYDNFTVSDNEGLKTGLVIPDIA